MKYYQNKHLLSSFSNKEFKRAIDKSNNLSTSSPNYISWRYLKAVVKNKKCLKNIVNIANTYIDYQYWLAHFKELFFIMILKPNKVSYDFLKIFHPIISLNTLGKLIKKVIRECFWFHGILNKFIYSNQLGELKQQSITNAGTFLTYLIWSE